MCLVTDSEAAFTFARICEGCTGGERPGFLLHAVGPQSPQPESLYQQHKQL